MQITVDRATVSFPLPDGQRLTALEGLSLEVPAGSVTAVIGPNGSGKSTLLRLIAGLVEPDAGRVGLGPNAEPPQAGDGRVGLVFQQPRLLPWLGVAENVELPLVLQGLAPDERGGRVAVALQRVGLADAAGLRPAALSGGMAQRAALARALVCEPPVLLLDEPFSALDALTREAFDGELQALLAEQPRTVVLVTHAVSEAVRLADRVAVLSARPGRVLDVVPVGLPRPRPVAIGAEPAAATVEERVRALLAEAQPPELRPWIAAPA